MPAEATDSFELPPDPGKEACWRLEGVESSCHIWSHQCRYRNPNLTVTLTLAVALAITLTLTLPT